MPRHFNGIVFEITSGLICGFPCYPKQFTLVLYEVEIEGPLLSLSPFKNGKRNPMEGTRQVYITNTIP